jgi:hypothetical protein
LRLAVEQGNRSLKGQRARRECTVMVNWTEKRIAKLKLLHKEGLSGAAIAKKLGPAFTKGIVIGKLRRLDVEPQQVVLGKAEAADGCVGF